MPRRNDSNSQRRGSARPRGSGPFSSKRTQRGKSSTKRDNDPSKRSDSPRNISSSVPGRRPKFQKTVGSAASRHKSATPRHPDNLGGRKKDFNRGQRDDNSTPRKGRFHAGARGRSLAPRRGEKPAAPGDQRAGKLNRLTAGQGFRKNTGFTKPYTKPYRANLPRKGVGHSRHHEKSGNQTTEAPSIPKSDKIRLNKFIANSGVSSRREADELITMGLISVNGKVVTELGYKVNRGDEVRYEDKVLRAEKPVYILLNKPKGFLTTTDDPQERKTVMHLIGAGVKERIYPVGRLDRNTTGLLLLTNDGDLADKLMHPSFNVRKIYKVELEKPLTKADFQAIAEGVRLDEGRATVDDIAIVSDDKRTIGIELHIGWNRVVRRIFETLGYEVLKLDRTVYAGLDKKDLGRGEWRFLTKEEIIHLKHFK